MKQILAILAVILLVSAPVMAQDMCEGDFDCDGDCDGTDASVFKSDFGRSDFGNPCPNCVPTIPYSKTGQTTCYDTDGNPRDCSGTGEDGEYQSGYDRFIDNGDDTVSDNFTGLMWTKNSMHFSETKTWQDALTACNDLDYAGYTNWKLPNVSEAKSLLMGTVLDRYFINPWDIWVWSSTTSAALTSGAWWVGTIGGGSMGYASKDQLLSAWCVRGG